MFSRREGESVDEFAARRARDRELAISGAPMRAHEASERLTADDEEHEMLGLSLLVCLLERMPAWRAARLVEYLRARYAYCDACGSRSIA